MDAETSAEANKIHIRPDHRPWGDALYHELVSMPDRKEIPVVTNGQKWLIPTVSNQLYTKVHDAEAMHLADEWGTACSNHACRTTGTAHDGLQVEVLRGSSADIRKMLLLQYCCYAKLQGLRSWDIFMYDYTHM